MRAWVGGATGAVLVLGGGGPVQEVSRGSVAVEVCRSGVSVEESVALRGGAVGWTELNSESTRREESKIQRVKKGQPPPKASSRQALRPHGTRCIDAENGKLLVFTRCPRHHASSASPTLGVSSQPGDDGDPIGRPAKPERRPRFNPSSGGAPEPGQSTDPQTGFYPQSCDSGAAPRTDPHMPSECTSTCSPE